MSWSSPDRGAPAAGMVMQFGALARGLTVLLLVASAVAFLVLTVRDRGGQWTIPMFLLAALTLALVGASVDVFRVAHRLRTDGIERVTPWSPRAVIRWSDVVSMEWIERTRWFEVRARSGERIRIPAQLEHLDAFARAALDGVPAAALDGQPGLRRRLEQLARGEPPPDEPEEEAWRGG